VFYGCIKDREKVVFCTLVSKKALPGLFSLLLLSAASAAEVQADHSLEARIQEIINLPEFQGIRWDVQVYSPDEDEVLYSLKEVQQDSPAVGHVSAKTGTASTSCWIRWLTRWMPTPRRCC
jgi:hypothetical protein